MSQSKVRVEPEVKPEVGEAVSPYRDSPTVEIESLKVELKRSAEAFFKADGERRDVANQLRVAQADLARAKDTILGLSTDRSRGLVDLPWIKIAKVLLPVLFGLLFLGMTVVAPLAYGYWHLFSQEWAIFWGGATGVIGLIFAMIFEVATLSDGGPG